MPNTYFITDSHLGSGADSPQRERDLVTFLSHIESDCTRLFLLGDIFDFWFSYKYVVPKGFVRILGQLARMADNGTEIHFFIGNHDMWLFDYLETEIGVIMHTEPCEMELDGKRFLIGHGDGLGCKQTHSHHDRNYLVLKSIFRCRFNQRLFSWINPRIGFGIALRWSRSSRKSNSMKYNHYLGDSREGIVIHCKERLATKPFDYFVFGHRHLPWRMELQFHDSSDTRKAEYINVGEWIEHRHYALFDGENMEMCEFEKATRE